MRLTLFAIAALTIFAVLVAGCTSQPPVQQAPATTVATLQTPVATTATLPPLPSNLAGRWELTLMGVQAGSAVTAPTADIDLYFGSDGTVSGNSGCNNYNAPFTLTGTTTDKGSGITIGTIVTTTQVCPTYAEQENTYLTILGKTMAYDVDTTQLTLTASDGNVLIYQRPSTIPKQTEGMLPA